MTHKRHSTIVLLFRIAPIILAAGMALQRLTNVEENLGAVVDDVRATRLQASAHGERLARIEGALDQLLRRSDAKLSALR